MRNFLLATLAAVALCVAGMGDTVGQSSGKQPKAKAAKAKAAKGKAAKGKAAKGKAAKGKEAKGNEGTEQNRWMVVRNHTKEIATSIYIIPSGEDCCWSRNLLEKNEIAVGKSLIVNFDDGSGKGCEFDIHVVGTGTMEWTFTKKYVCADQARFAACDGEEICLQERTNKKREVTVSNASSLTALSVYAVPSDKECCWSSDLFGPRVLNGKDDKGKPREEVIDLDDNGRQPGSECKFDIRVTSNLRADWRFYGIDACGANSKITLKDVSPSQDVKDEKDEAKKNKRRLKVKNESNLTALYAFAIPSGEECCWSRDLFGLHFLPGKDDKGKVQEREIDLDDGNGKCTFDIRFLTRAIPDDDGGPIRAKEEWNFDRLNVCDMKDRVISLQDGR